MFLSSTPIYFQVSILLHDRIYDRNISLFIPSRIHFVLRRGLRFDANQRSCPTAARKTRRGKKKKKKRERKGKRKKRTSFHEVVNFEVGVSIYVHLKYDGHEDRFSSFFFFFYIYIWKREEKKRNPLSIAWKIMGDRLNSLCSRDLRVRNRNKNVRLARR